jgi:hypothetical protein
MNAHQVRYRKIYEALSQVIHQTYGTMPRQVLQDVTAEVVTVVILEQAYTEKAWRDIAERADLPRSVVTAAVDGLQAPIGQAPRC